MKLFNQNTSLVSSIQQYVNDLYINKAEVDFGLPNQILPTTKSLSFNRITSNETPFGQEYIVKSEQTESKKGLYNLWSGIDLLEIVLREKEDEISKRSDSELKKTGQTSDKDCNTFAEAVRKTMKFNH